MAVCPARLCAEGFSDSDNRLGSRRLLRSPCNSSASRRLCSIEPHGLRRCPSPPYRKKLRPVDPVYGIYGWFELLSNKRTEATAAGRKSVQTRFPCPPQPWHKQFCL